jgi:hypothetical protein
VDLVEQAFSGTLYLEYENARRAQILRPEHSSFERREHQPARDAKSMSIPAATDYRFFTEPIRNSPYEYPREHWELDSLGQPTQNIIKGRRRAEFITPIPTPKKRKTKAQQTIVFDEGKGISTEKQQYDPTSIINELRSHVDQWRNLSNPNLWQVTPESVLDPYNPTGSTMHVNFNTSKNSRWETDARRCHINWVILDSDWEAEFCRVAEARPTFTISSTEEFPEPGFFPASTSAGAD